MAKYVRPRLVVEAVPLAPEIAQKLGYAEGAYLVNGSQGSQYVRGISDFEREFRLVERKPRTTHALPPRLRKPRGRKSGQVLQADGQGIEVA